MLLISTLYHVLKVLPTFSSLIKLIALNSFKFIRLFESIKGVVHEPVAFNLLRLDAYQFTHSRCLHEIKLKLQWWEIFNLLYLFLAKFLTRKTWQLWLLEDIRHNRGLFVGQWRGKSLLYGLLGVTILNETWKFYFVGENLVYIFSRMKILDMLLETAFIRAKLVATLHKAPVVCPTFFVFVNHLVLFQIWATTEFLSTDIAGIWFFSGMYSPVTDQVGYLRKSVTASRIFTKVWLFLVMDPLVFLKTRVLNKSGGTFWAKNKSSL